MGIGMKTRTPSQGTFNQEPKKKRTTAAEITDTASKPTTKKK